jgi:glutathione peroxidase
MDQTVYQFTMKDISGNDVSLEQYKGKVILIVNTASECGLTPQYEHLEGLWKQLKSEDFVILGFPANNFGSQEPGTDSEIASFCKVNYGVTFPMFSKISVKGEEQHPLYNFLTHKSLNGAVDTDMQWNFQKFLVDKEGKVVQTIAPTTTVLEDQVLDAIQAALQ